MQQKSKITTIAFILLIAIAAIVYYYIKISEQISPDKFLGKWKTVLELKNKKYLLIADFSKDNENNIALKISIPKQHVLSIPVDTFAIENKEISFKLNKIRLTYNGEIISDSNKIAGNITLGKVTRKLDFYREDEFVRLNRPQTPVKPYPYKSIDVTIYSIADSIDLTGTYTRPDKDGAFPTILLISGVGPQDRDEGMYGHRPFLILADYFTRLGFGVLRVDDRGTGESEGNYYYSTTRDFANDAISCINYLKKMKSVDSTKIGIIGFNEGGLIASIVASELNDIAFLVLLATPGLPGSDILLSQTRLIQRAAGVKEKEIEQDYGINQKMFKVIKAMKDSSRTVKKLENIFDKFRHSLSKVDADKWKYSPRLFKEKVRFMLTPWFRYYLTYDPAEIIYKVKCPVLVLYGKKDLQVSPGENLQAIENAFKKGGNTNVKSMILPGLNHLFQKCETGLPKEYSQIKETFSPQAMKIISDWIFDLLKKK